MYTNTSCHTSKQQHDRIQKRHISLWKNVVVLNLVVVFAASRDAVVKALRLSDERALENDTTFLVALRFLSREFVDPAELRVAVLA